MPEVKHGNHQSSRTEDLLLNREALESYDHECKDIYFFTQREITLLYSCIRFADWEARWVDRDKDTPLVEQTKRKLLMLCAKDLVKAQVAVVMALTGRQIDLGNDSEVEGFLNSFVDFTEDGVVPAIDRLSGAGENDYSDELQAIGAILGAVAV